jgi:hypothetical protein
MEPVSYRDGKQVWQCSSCRYFKTSAGFHERPKYSAHGREVAYQCKACKKERDRSSEVWRRAFKKHGVVCASCDRPRKLATATECAACLKGRGLRVCRGCKETKLALLDFRFENRTCLECQAPSPEAQAVLDRKLKSKELLASLPPAERELHQYLEKKYGLSLAQYRNLEHDQDGVCKVCKTKPKGRLVVDHDHATGSVRGLLCSQCNTGLGMFRDSPDLLAAAAGYLTSQRADCAA